MSTNAEIDGNRPPEGPLTQMEPGVTNSTPPSVASSENGSEGSEQELWDALEDVLEAQEDQFVERDEVAQPGAAGSLFDTPATPVIKTPSTSMSPIPSLQRQYVDLSLVSGPTLSPSASPLKLRFRPLSPTRPIMPDLKSKYQPRISPHRPHVLLPSQHAIVAGRSARTNPARESPSHRFFASPDQIGVLGMPRTWLHSQVISTLGDTFCYASRSKPRHEHYDILPTDLFEMWNLYMGGHLASRAFLSFHFKQAVRPLECRAWLVPVLLEHHWYLLVLDWMDSDLRIYDSLATGKISHPSLVEFGGALLDLITEDLDLEQNDWYTVSEHVSGFIIA